MEGKRRHTTIYEEEFDFLKHFDPTECNRTNILKNLEFGWDNLFQKNLFYLVGTAGNNVVNPRKKLEQINVYLTEYGDLFYPNLRNRIINIHRDPPVFLTIARPPQELEDYMRIYKRDFLPKLLEHPVCKKEQELIREQVVGGTQKALLPELEEIIGRYAFRKSRKHKKSRKLSKF